MAFEPAEIRDFDVLQVGPLQRTKGNPFIECKTSLGTVAFWGGSSMDNLSAIQSQSPPFRIRCGCRPPMPNFPTHVLWVPESARLDFTAALSAEITTRPASEITETTSTSTLYVVNCTKAKIWDVNSLAPEFVPAWDAYRGHTVREWLTSAECKNSARWVFLSARYGFIEPNHPIARYDVTFADPASGPMPDDALRAQIHGQRRWHDRVPLREFRNVYVWSESATYEHKTRGAFHGVDAVIARLTRLRPNV